MEKEPSVAKVEATYPLLARLDSTALDAATLRVHSFARTLGIRVSTIRQAVDRHRERTHGFIPLTSYRVSPRCGKTHAIRTAARFHPSHVVQSLTAMSERALAYSQFDAEHAYVVIAESSALHRHGVGATIVRQLAWDNQLRYELVEKTSDGLRARVIERPGPTGLITTTTRPLDPEIATRVVRVPISDTPEQTATIIRALARKAKGKTQEHRDLSSWIAASEWLAQAAAVQVVVPYAEDLAKLVPAEDVRMRRDFTQVLTVVQTLAFMHQLSRDRDERGRIVASPPDYAVAHRLLSGLFATDPDQVPDAIRETVHAVMELNMKRGNGNGSSVNGARAQDDRPLGVSYPELAARLGLSRSSVWSRAKRAIRKGYLINSEQRSRYPARLTVADALPEPQTVLPHPRQVFGEDL